MSSERYRGQPMHASVGLAGSLLLSNMTKFLSQPTDGRITNGTGCNPDPNPDPVSLLAIGGSMSRHG